MAIVFNMIKSDTMITLLDVILDHTAIDATCNLNSGKDEIKRNESQLLITMVKRNSAAMLR